MTAYEIIKTCLLGVTCLVVIIVFIRMDIQNSKIDKEALKELEIRNKKIKSFIEFCEKKKGEE